MDLVQMLLDVLIQCMAAFKIFQIQETMLNITQLIMVFLAKNGL